VTSSIAAVIARLFAQVHRQFGTVFIKGEDHETTVFNKVAQGQ
jgi:hypothetical protein